MIKRKAFEEGYGLRLNEFIDQSREEDKIAELKREFPGLVFVYPAGSEWYQYSKSLEELLQSQHFDPEKSKIGQLLFFSDKPKEAKTNIKVTLKRTAILLGQDNPLPPPNDSKDTFQVVHDKGFDGAISGYEGGFGSDKPTRYLPEGGKEIILFPIGISCLGLIESYK